MAFSTALNYEPRAGSQRQFRTERPNHMNCPRCQKPLRATGDADYGWCLDHGEIFIGEPPLEKGYGDVLSESAARQRAYRSHHKQKVEMH